jgi:hypothetical protein
MAVKTSLGQVKTQESERCEKGRAISYGIKDSG